MLFLYISSPAFWSPARRSSPRQTLEDASFNNGDRILLLVCEEGVEEYDPSAFAAPTVFTETIESESDLTTENLAALLKKHRCSYVMVEYNGMWTLDTLYTNMPKEWIVAQEIPVHRRAHVPQLQ